MKKYIIYCFIMVISIIFFIEIPVYANQYREATNIDNFDDTKYPGYKEKLKQLKQEHPNWNFVFFYTGLDWYTVVYNETNAHHGRSLVQRENGEWVCPTCGYVPKEGYNWYCASEKAVSYYLDPRNFLDTKNLFQFETLSYIDGSYTEDGVERILKGTFMYNTTIKNYYNNEKYVDKKFSTVILEAAKESKISPYHIASRIRQEIIVSGGGPSNSVTGKVDGYEELYNFYNIQASGQDAIKRGLQYAEKNVWNTPEISIKEGAKIIASNYILKGQDTLYLEKFDVDDSNNSLYYHQYQQNIEAPYSEGGRIYNSIYLPLEMLGNSFNFIIPVYENMPKTISEKPSNDTPIPTTPIEEPYGEEMKVIANGSLKLRENPTTSSNIVTLIATGSKVYRLEKNVVNANGYDWDKVITITGKIGYVASKYIQPIQLEIHEEENKEPIVLSDGSKIYVDKDNKYIFCEPKTTLQDIKNSKIGENMIAKDVSGEIIENIDISAKTGMQVIIDDILFYIIKYGDVSGDGIIDARDSLRILKYSVNDYNLDDKAFFSAADINKDGIVDARDSLRILKYNVGEFIISIE